MDESLAVDVIFQTIIRTIFMLSIIPRLVCRSVVVCQFSKIRCGHIVPPGFSVTVTDCVE